MMGEVLRAEWFDLAEDTQDEIWVWLHKEYLPALCAADGVAWIGHYEIIEQPDQPYIDGAPNKKTIDDPSVPTGWRNVILTAAASPEVYFGSGDPIDAIENDLSTDSRVYQLSLENEVGSIQLENAADTGDASFIILEDYIVGDYETDKTSQNELFDQLDDTVLDFTESNPFGDVGSTTKC